MTFEPGHATEPFSIHTAPSLDVAEILPERAKDLLKKLRQRASDAHSLIPDFAEIREASEARIQAETRLKRLLDHQADNGFHLGPSDPRVLEQRKLLAKLTDEFTELTSLQAERSKSWRERSQLVANVEDLVGIGRPPGTTLQDHDGPPPQLLKNEGLLDGILRLQRRARELRADLHRIRSAPYTSNFAKQLLREEIEVQVQQGEPDISALIEHGRAGIVWPMTSVQAQVYNAQPGAIGFVEVPAVVALVAWAVGKDALVQRLDALIDLEKDDASALTSEARQKAEAEVLGDLLSVEREESFFVWAAMEQRLPAQHRADCNPLAILQVRLVQAQRADPSPKTSPMHAIDLIGARQR